MIYVRQKPFREQINKWINKVHDSFDETVRESLVLIFDRIDERSPIGDPKLWKHPAPPGYRPGRFRGSWVLGIDAVNFTVPRTRDPHGMKISVARAMTKVPNGAAGHTYFYTSSLPYSLRLEYGWSHRQAPYGVIAVTAMEFRRIINKAIKEMRS